MISSVHRLSPLSQISLIFWPRCFFPGAQCWKQMCSCLHTEECFCCAPQTAVCCTAPAHTPSGRWVRVDGGATLHDLALCRTVNAFFQYKLHGCGPTCRCCVNSSLHLFFVPVRFQPCEEEVKSQHCLSTSACTLLYWWLCKASAAPCSMISQTFGICVPVTRFLVVSESALPSQLFDTVVAAFWGLQKYQTGFGIRC